MIAKKGIILPFVILITVIILISSALFYLNLKERKADSTLLIKETNEIIYLSTQKKTPESIQKLLNQLSNKNLNAEKKYQIMTDVGNYLGSLYNETRSPGIRNFIKDPLGKFAKENFPKNYNPRNFEYACADPICGEKIDPEMEKVLKDIDSSSISQLSKDIIKYNLTLALYLSEDNMQEKETGLRLAISQLISEGNPVASKSAEIIKNYYHTRYKGTL